MKELSYNTLLLIVSYCPLLSKVEEALAPSHPDLVKTAIKLEQDIGYQTEVLRPDPLVYIVPWGQEPDADPQPIHPIIDAYQYVHPERLEIFNRMYGALSPGLLKDQYECFLQQLPNPPSADADPSLDL